MPGLTIQDLPESLELDRKAMQDILGGSRSADQQRRPEFNRKNSRKQRLLQRLRKG